MRKGLVVAVVAAAAVAAYAGFTRAAGSSRAAVSSEHVSLAVTASAGTVRVDGAVDNVRHQASFTIDLSDAGGLTPLQLPTTRLDTVVDASSGRFDAYVRVPTLARFFTQGKPWVKVDADQLAGTKVAPLTKLATAPSQLLAALRSVSSGEETVGTETVDGVVTTHARLTVDVRRLATLAPRRHRAMAAAALDELVRASGIQPQRVDVWTDSAGLLRRAAATLHGDDAASFDLRLSDFGAGVDVEIPSAADTFDAS